jgi:predicted dehydrogenase
MKLLLIGSGIWGKNYISTLSNFPKITLEVADRNNWKNLIDQQPGGAIIATPPQSHVEIASYALEKNIPTLIEKPLSLSLNEAKTLQKYTAPILVNHIHLFSDTFQQLKSDIDISSIKNIYSIGTGNNKERDYSRLWDYGCHNIAEILYLTQKYPNKIDCEKTSDKTFIISLQFDTIHAVIHVGYAKEKMKLIEINEEVVYNGLIEQSPLTNALSVFINAVDGKKDDRLGLNLSLDVLRILEDCENRLHS